MTRARTGRFETVTDRDDTVLARIDDDLVVRVAGPEDFDGVVALNVAVFGEQDRPGVRALLEGDTGVEWLVAAAGPDADRPGGGTLACGCARIPHRFELDGTSLPGSQIENVTTDERFRGRGLVRALFDAHHRRAADAGELLQVIGGIPYFYRKLGYGYGFDVPTTISVGTSAAPAVDGSSITVRPLQADDLPWLVGLEAERSRDGLTVRRTPEVVAVWLARGEATGATPWESLLVAERGGTPVGWVRTITWAEEAQFFVLPGHCPDLEVADQLLAHALVAAQRMADLLGRPLEILASDHPGSPWSRAVHRAGRPRPEPSAYYARTADPVGLLRAIEPVLSARISGSGLAADRGEVTISLYERGIRVAWDAGRVTAIESAAPDTDPFDHGGVGVAPDWFPALVLGRWGASGLAERTDDTILGDHVAVMDVLFPDRPNDVVPDL